MNKKIIIAAGGTGGHIFPGLAVAQQLISKGCVVEWIGTLQGLESKLIPKHNINIHYIDINGFRGKNILTKIFAPINILIAIIQSLKLLIKLNPEVVLGMGGFISGPVGIAAWLLRKRLIIHEQNSIAGTSNRILGFFADKILVSFMDSFPKNQFYVSKIILTGNPIRKDFTIHSSEINIKSHDPFKILVLGGSRGARFLNELVPAALGSLDDLKILHQTGEQDLAYTEDLYLKNGAKAKQHEIKPFIDDMVAAYLSADLVICRSGASTVFEIMATGVASIMVPLPWAIDDHQTKNAKYLADHNAGILVAQANLTPEKLRELVLDLKNNYFKILEIKKAIKLLYEQYNIIDSAEKIADLILIG